MVWVTSTNFSSKCVQMDHQRLLKMIKIYSVYIKCVMQKNVGVVTTPLVAWGLSRLFNHHDKSLPTIGVMKISCGIYFKQRV